MSGMGGYPGSGFGQPGHNPMNQMPNFVNHLIRPMGMNMAPSLNPCQPGACCANACTFDCLCHLIDSDSKGIDVDDIYQVLGRDALKSSVLDDIDLYLECDDDNIYNKAMPLKPGMESAKPKNPQESFKFKFSFPTNSSTPSASDSKKSFVCQFCSQSFIKDHLLKNHQAKAHNVKDLFPCPQCAYRGQQHAHLQKHIKRMHKKSSNSDEGMDSSTKIATGLPPGHSDSQPGISKLGVPQSTDPNASIESMVKWSSVSDKQPAPCDSGHLNSTNQAQKAETSVNIHNVMFPSQADSIPRPSPLPAQSLDQKVPVGYCHQSIPGPGSFGAEPSPGSRSAPESSPRPGSLQSSHEGGTEFSILDISNNTYNANTSAAFLPGESLLAQLEGPDMYDTPKVGSIPFPVPSSPCVLGRGNPVSPSVDQPHTPHQLDKCLSGIMPQGSPSVDNMLNQSRGMNYRNIPPSKCGNIDSRSDLNQNFVSSPPNYPPRIAPTPPDLLDPKRRKVSPSPHAVERRNSASSMGNASQNFPPSSPSNSAPRIAPTPPDMTRPQMSPMSQSSSQHSSPSLVHGGFVSPSPPVSQPRVLPPPSETVHSVSPTIPRGSHFQGNTTNAMGGVLSPRMSTSSGFPRPTRTPTPDGLRQIQLGMPPLVRQTSPQEPPRYAPRMEMNRPYMHQVNRMGMPPNTLNPSYRYQHMENILLENQQRYPMHPGLQNPVQRPNYHPNQFGHEYGTGQYMAGQTSRFPYNPRNPLQMSQNIPAGMNYSPHSSNPRFMYSAGPSSGPRPPGMGQMYGGQPQGLHNYGPSFNPHGSTNTSGHQESSSYPPGIRANSPMAHFPSSQGMHNHYISKQFPNMAQNLNQTPNMEINAVRPQGCAIDVPYQPPLSSPPAFTSTSARSFVPEVSAGGNAVQHILPRSAYSELYHGQMERHLGEKLGSVEKGQLNSSDMRLLNVNNVDKNEYVKGMGTLSDNSRLGIKQDQRNQNFSCDEMDSSKGKHGVYSPHSGNSAVDVPVSKYSDIVSDVYEGASALMDGGEKLSSDTTHSEDRDAVENLLNEEQQGSDKVNEKINWLLLHCGVNKPSNRKGNNSDKCRLEIKTSEEEIGPVVHIMETQENEADVDNLLDDISKSESDATQSDSGLPVISPQGGQVFSPPCESVANSPPKLVCMNTPECTNEWKCEKCDFVCANKHLLKSHEKNKHDPDRKIYKCETCSVELKQKSSYENHVAKHNGEMKYECHVCHKLFANRLSFNLHLKTHSAERPFKCGMEACEKAFRTKSDLNEHAKVVHGEKIYACTHEGCERSYALEKDLRAHQVSHGAALKCTWPRCRKTFRDRYNLNNHYKTHTKEKPIKCCHCDFSCIQRSSLESHMKNHHPDRPGYA